MKKIKLTFATIVLLIVLVISTSSNAYNGAVDTTYDITMPAVLTEGKGSVISTGTGDFKYQFVETTEEKYLTLKKLADQLELVNAFIKGQYENWESAEANSNYGALVTKYESTYNEKVITLYSNYGVFNNDTVAIIRSLWIHELPNFDSSKWTNGTSSQISLDLSTFTGTKYYVAWVQIGDTYDAEVYIVKGTKTNNQDNNNTGDDNKTGDDNTINDDNKTGDDNTIKDDNKTGDDNNTDGNNVDNDKTDDDKNNSNNKTPTNKTNDTPKKDTSGDKTLKPVEELPYTGIITNIIFYGLLISAIVSAIISFKRYKKIK